eukprot:TRINITY_DN15551_c4_g2_i2.p1 TRINITY_DN15551_c4_g2~~TRINITY_DN15551_c4_g2_i2.p1  ORF type:complete len:623 (-),score=176.57 TRINITY_DN15551_c4_g2_i2:552-2420(-)
MQGEAWLFFDGEEWHADASIEVLRAQPDASLRRAKEDQQRGQNADQNVLADWPDAPSALLLVRAGGRCEGIYHLDLTLKANNRPVWRHMEQPLWIFNGPSGQWFVGDDEEESANFECDTGHFASKKVSKKKLPHEIRGWLYFDGSDWHDVPDMAMLDPQQLQQEEKEDGFIEEGTNDAALKVEANGKNAGTTTAASTLPQSLFVGCSIGWSGWYELERRQSANEHPIWKLRDEGSWIFQGTSGQWFIGDEDERSEGFDCATGNIASRKKAKGRLPHEMTGGWMCFVEEEWHEEPDVLVARREDLPSSLALTAPAGLPFAGMYSIGEAVNGRPLWKHVSADFWLFRSVEDLWMVGQEAEERENFEGTTGVLVSRLAAEQRMPQEMNAEGWLLFGDDGAWHEQDGICVDVVPADPAVAAETKKLIRAELLEGDTLGLLFKPESCPPQVQKVLAEAREEWNELGVVRGSLLATVDGVSVLEQKASDLVSVLRKRPLKLEFQADPVVEEAAPVEEPAQTGPNAKDKQGMTALHRAAEAGEEKECMKILANSEFEAINEQDRIGKTALHYAAEVGLSKVCELILNHPDFTAAHEEDFLGMTAQELAEQAGFEELADTLAGLSEHGEF